MVNHKQSARQRPIFSEFFRIRYDGEHRNRQPDQTISAPATGAVLHLSGTSHTVLLTGGQTGDALALIESVMPPEGGSPTHIHHREDETVIVLEGTVWFRLGHRTFVAGPNASVFVPRGTPHRVRNVTRAPARLLTAFTPAGHERMYVEVGRPAEPGVVPGPPDAEEHARLLTAAPKYDLELLATG